MTTPNQIRTLMDSLDSIDTDHETWKDMSGDAGFINIPPGTIEIIQDAENTLGMGSAYGGSQNTMEEVDPKEGPMVPQEVIDTISVALGDTEDDMGTGGDPDDIQDALDGLNEYWFEAEEDEDEDDDQHVGPEERKRLLKKIEQLAVGDKIIIVAKNGKTYKSTLYAYDQFYLYHNVNGSSSSQSGTLWADIKDIK